MNINAANFTIFLPVKSEGEYLPLYIASIMAQTYQGLELVILENQSTDGAAQWLQTLGIKILQVRVICSESLLSIEDNWKRILAAPKSKFMTIIGHDDLPESDLLDEMNNLIQGEQEENLYLTRFKLIDSEGKFIRYCRSIPKFETAGGFLAAGMAEIP